MRISAQVRDQGCAHEAKATTAGQSQALRVEPKCSGGGSAVSQGAHQARSLARSRAMLWLCSWHTRDSVTLSTAAISLRFMSCS